MKDATDRGQLSTWVSGDDPHPEVFAEASYVERGGDAEWVVVEGGIILDGRWLYRLDPEPSTILASGGRVVEAHRATFVKEVST